MSKTLLFTDCVDLVGSACKPFEGTKKYVSTGAVDVDHIVDAETETVDFEGRPSRANLEVVPGDVLFAKMQGTKKTILIDSALAQNVYSTGFCAVHAKEGLLTNRFLMHLLTSETFLSQKDKNCSGATQKAITNAGLSKISINVPSIEEQDGLSDQIDIITSVIAKRRSELAALDNLIKARFVEMFGDPANNSGEGRVELSDICEKITDGEHGSVARVPNGHPFLNAKHILKNGRIDWDTITYVGEEDHNRIYKRCNPEEGDILLTTTGTIGNVAIMPKSEKVSMDRGITLLKIDRKKVTSEFVAELLKQPSIQMEMGVNVHASAIGHLFMNKVKKLPAILPSMEKQIEFTDFVKQVDKSKAVVQKALDKAQLLFDSLMQECFE